MNEKHTAERENIDCGWFVCELCFGPMLMSADEYEAELETGLLVGCQSCEGKPREEAW